MKQLEQVQILKQQIKTLLELLESASNNNAEVEQLKQQINEYEKNIALLDAELQSIIDELKTIINEG